MRVVVLSFVLALVAPSASAAWYAYGAYEPDTTLDVRPFMWDDVPVTITNRVYFNVYATWGDQGANGGFVNPNVGILHTNLDPAGPIFWEGLFGVWTDCNGDGYVGMLESAIDEYDARLLLDDSICPATTGPKNKWAGGNNYNGWVSELIPIGNMEISNADTRIYRDLEAMVWGDPGRPDDAVAPPGVVCQGAARGTFATTGGILWWLDCQGNGVNVAAGIRAPIVRTFNEADATLGTGLGLGDDPADSSSPLNQPTFGSDSSENTAVIVQDCDAEPVVETGDVAAGDDLDHIVLVREPAPSVNGDVGSWTVPGTMNYTSESIYAPNGTYSTGSSSNCDFSDDQGQDFYGLFEGDVDVPPYQGKDAAWRNFGFLTQSRGTLPAAFYQTGCCGAGSGSAGVPTDLGIDALGIECGPSSCWNSYWFGGTDTWITPTLDVKYSLTEPDVPSVDIAKAPYYTFYAHVGAQTLARGFSLPGGVGAYGAGQCGDATSGTQAGWNCDAAAWYRRSDGSYPNSPRPLARVGQPYEFRDVDCMDGSVGSTGIGISPAYYGSAPCDRPG